MVRPLLEAGPFTFPNQISSLINSRLFCAGPYITILQQGCRNNNTIRVLSYNHLIYIQVDQLEILIELDLKTVAEFYIIAPFVTANRHNLLPCIL